LWQQIGFEKDDYVIIGTTKKPKSTIDPTFLLHMPLQYEVFDTLKVEGMPNTSYDRNYDAEEEEEGDNGSS
jgi:hypothetical protein